MKVNKIYYKHFKNKGYNSFSEIKFQEGLKLIDVSSNPIKNFKGLNEQPQLSTLQCDNTIIESFEGAQFQPALYQLSFHNTPLSRSFVSKPLMIQIMALVSFGPSLNNVNGIIITKKARQLAASLAEKIRPYLNNGFVLISASPPTVAKLGVSNLNASKKSKSESYDAIEIDLDVQDSAEEEKKVQTNNDKLKLLRERIKNLKTQKKEMMQKKEKDIVKSFVTQPQKRPARKARNVQKEKEQKNSQQENHPQEEQYHEEENLQ